MPGAKTSTAPWRRWASKLHLIVTDDGATIDFYGGDDEPGYPTILNFSELGEVTDRDLLRLLTPGVQSVNLKGCRNFTDASILAVAEGCPNLTELNVSGCGRLTDASIAAVAEKCPKLATLKVQGCGRLTDASITAVAGKCPKLAKLDASYCRNLTDASLADVADSCANLTELDVTRCNLTALPANIGKLSRLRKLLARVNQLKELPRSIVELDASCSLEISNNPLQTPPPDIARRGIPAIQRYFEELDDTA